MNIIEAVILGAIQGITEFLPISSSGHLIFVPELFGWADQGLWFDVVVHLGSLVAVLIFFRKKIIEILGRAFKGQKEQVRLFVLLMLSVVPAGVVGLLLGDWIENVARSAQFIAYGLIVWGIVLFIADRYNAQQKDHTELNEVSWKQVIVIACAQAIALIPGTSRSGITMSAGLLGSLSKKAAAEFSFLMSIPVILLAGQLKFYQVINLGSVTVGFAPLVVGFVSAAISGFIAIYSLMHIIEKWNFSVFVLYRIVVGVLILMYLV